MKLILDTHTFLWFINGDKKLSKTARELIENPDNHNFISMASLWEISIKSSLNKLQIELPFATFYQNHVLENGFNILQIEVSHVQAVYNLPFHHGDPFDRLIIAQSQIENMPIITIDDKFENYAIKCLW